MTNEQREARQICRDAHCRLFHRCQVYWGRKCTWLGGRKVPRVKLVPYREKDETIVRPFYGGIIKIENSHLLH